MRLEALAGTVLVLVTTSNVLVIGATTRIMQAKLSQSAAQELNRMRMAFDVVQESITINSHAELLEANHAGSGPQSVPRQDGRTTASLSRKAYRAVLGLAVLALLMPLLVVDVPPVLDYPNHLARLVVLAAGPGDAVLGRFYAPHWGIIPNLAVDLLGVPLVHLLPVHTAGRVLLAVALLLPMGGALAYHRALFGSRRPWALGSALVACNFLLLMGFLNCLIATGMALLVASCWVRWRRHFPARTVLLCAAGAAIVFFCHLFGVLFLAILLAAQEADGLHTRWRQNQPLVAAAAGSAVSLLGVLLPALVLTFASAFSAEETPPLWLPLAGKLIGLLDPVLNYHSYLDLLTGVLLLMATGLAAARGYLRMPVSTGVALIVLLTLYAVSPFTAKGGAWIDSRFSLAAGIMLFAGCDLRGVPMRIAKPLACGLAALFLIRGGVVATNWAGHRSDLRELRASIAAVPAGSRVLVVSVSPRDHPEFWSQPRPGRQVSILTTAEVHDAALLLIERRAFWPLLFANPAQQPIMVRPPYLAITAQLGIPPDYGTLLRNTHTPTELRNAPYLREWQHNFDAVLALDAEGVPDLSELLPDVLTPINRTGFAALFRIHAPAEVPARALVAGSPR